MPPARGREGEEVASAQGPRLSTSSGSSWDYLQFPSPRAHPFTLISGALGGGFRPTCLHSTSPGSCQEKEARAHCGWPQAWRGGAGEQGGEWASGGPDTSPPPSRQPPHPAPKGCTVCPGAGRMENAPPPRACHHACAWSALSLSSQDVLPAGTRGTPSRQGAAWRRSQGQGTSCHCRSAG